MSTNTAIHDRHDMSHRETGNIHTTFSPLEEGSEAAIDSHRMASGARRALALEGKPRVNKVYNPKKTDVDVSRATPRLWTSLRRVFGIPESVNEIAAVPPKGRTLFSGIAFICSVRAYELLSR